MSEYVGLAQGKVHDRREMSEYYCGGCGYPVTDHDSYCRECGGALHKGMAESRYAELFGTPERAARTLYEAEGWTCPECPIRNQCKANWPYEPCPTNDYDSLLEWLRGDAE